jgi:hypothetical protein
MHGLRLCLAIDHMLRFRITESSMRETLLN